MRKVFRFLAIVVACLAGIAAVLVSCVFIFFPNVGPPPDIRIVLTPHRIERGKYLFNNAAGCVSCHSQRDEARFTMPIKTGTEGAGGEVFDQRLGFPGSFTAKNLTPAHLGNWTDGDIYRAMISGVSKDGRALFPIMPYENYARMDREDIYSIIAYLRTLKPVPAAWPAAHFDFPMNIIVRTIPKKTIPATAPDTSNPVAYGQYLVNMANCMTCHTQARQGRIIGSLAFGGGREMKLPTGAVIKSANITPDIMTGIGSWSRKDFVRHFKIYADSSFVLPTIGKNQFNTIMPWTLYAKLTTADLEAIYAYLHTVQPIKNKVEKFSNVKR